MNTFTEKANEIRKQNAEIISNLKCLDKNQFNTAEFELLTKNIEMLVKSQTVVIKQIEQNTEFLETLTGTVNDLMDISNGKYKFI